MSKKDKKNNLTKAQRATSQYKFSRNDHLNKSVQQTGATQRSGHTNAAVIAAIGRVTIKTVGPLSLGSGETEFFCENEEKIHYGALMRDGNGLPVIPATSFQGVLRHLWRDSYGAHDVVPNVKDVFGEETGDDGRPGAVIFGFGYINRRDGNGKDVAIVGLTPRSELQTDTRLMNLLLPEQDEPKRSQVGAEIRDHIKLSGRLAVEGRTKHVRAFVPEGLKFSAEFAVLSHRCPAGETPRALLEKLFGLMNHSGFRLGGAAARGYGTVKVDRVEITDVTADNPAMLRALRLQPPSASFGNGAKDIKETLPKADNAVVRLMLHLSPKQTFRIGSPNCESYMKEGGKGVFRHDTEEVKSYLRTEVDDILTGEVRNNLSNLYRSRRGVASGFKRITDLVVPGSSVRGPLVHRALFHANAAAGRVVRVVDDFFDPGDHVRPVDVVGFEQRDTALKLMLGHAKERSEGSHRDDVGSASLLIVGDAEVKDPVAVQVVHRSRLDRFSGGVSNGGLFAQEVVICDQKTTITVELVIREDIARTRWKALSERRNRQSAVEDDVEKEMTTARAALAHAIADLCKGSLAIGSNNLGLCTGNVEIQAGGAKAGWKDALTAAGVPISGATV